MTAEILIMNPSAISMATDSVVTVGDKKTYSGVNKLFMLSNNHPMGIMIYGNANFMEMPMESLIKEYRKICETKEYKTVKEFADNFMIFLKDYSFSKSDPKEIFEKYLNDFKDKMPDDFINELINDTDDILNKLNSQFDKKFLNFLKSKEYGEYDHFFDKIIGDNPNVYSKQKIKIKEILQKYFIVFLLLQSTGIVISGFNEEDIYPSFSANNILTIVKDELWFDEIFKKENYKYPIIQPFAQTDVVNTFLMGVDMNILNSIGHFFKNGINDYTNMIFEIIEKNKKLTKKELNNLKNEIIIFNENNNRLLEEYEALIKNLVNSSNNPISNSINALPKEELGNMAESLIHITSLKRKFEEELETVGGDIDVAIISKGDGFIWAKRKHYFDPGLNYQFFNRKN